MIKHIKILFLLLFILTKSFLAQNVVVVIIDGARYTETFGDVNRTFIPFMSELASEGTYVDEFYNDGYTYTSRAIPALWCGAWTDLVDINYNGSNTQYTVSPTLFEYFEKQKNPGANKNVYVLKYVSSLWLQSFHPEYGPDYWPVTYSEGSTDVDVLDKSLQIMEEDHPQFLWVYLADVDHAGHLGVWDGYTDAISTADSIVNVLWQTIQIDDFYKDNTTLLVTNDHGRHDYDFTGHGCSCDGCRHIMFLALGPNIKQNYVSTQTRYLPDFAVTAAEILDVDMEYATGHVMNEILINVNQEDLAKNDFKINSKFIQVDLPSGCIVKVDLYDLTGRKITTLVNEKGKTGENFFNINTSNYKGLYIVQLRTEFYTTSKKVIFNL
ncbi:MAG: alkaline phosphatase family protein [Bacteroidales bacterium]|nr:alkaline phosphatase family protein [Bacteroidales bacterium]